MRYQLQPIDNASAGKTMVMLKTDVFHEIAEVPWKRGDSITVYLHPDNAAEVSGPTAEGFTIVARPDMPVLEAGDLDEILNIIKTNGRNIQSQNRQPFRLP